ncbi:MAG: inorganic phosphate transporter [Alphaproteobacteria bacterium]|nr:inorganic phosphate transporter [Alphaproteobacteria bacterium]
MMVSLFLLGGILLAFTFGRNNFSNVFGSAIGTGVLSLKSAALLTTFFLLLGILFGSSDTSETVAGLTHFTHLSESFLFSVIIATIMIFLTKLGFPASLAQISIGGLIGWNLGLGETVKWTQIKDIGLGWIYSPIIACVFSYLIFKSLRFFLKKYPVPILYRDIYVRIFWIFVGSFTAYGLGSNSLPVLIIPFAKTVSYDDQILLPFLFSIAVGSGCLMASHRVIRMISSKLFPLSSVESLIVGFSGALTLLIFSLHNHIIPALPISISAALIGAIVGVSMAKGGYGLKKKALIGVVCSWILAPLFSGLICFGFVCIIRAGRF